MKPDAYRDWASLLRKLWPSVIGSIILWAAVITGIILLAGCGGRAQDAAIGGLYGVASVPPSPYAWTPGDNSGQQWLETQQMLFQQQQQAQQMQRAQQQQQLQDMGLSPWQN